MAKSSKYRFGLREIPIRFETFEYDATCVVGPLPKLEHYVQWAFVDKTFTIEREYEGLFLARDGREPILWIPARPKTPKELGTLVHESMHLVHHMLKWANITLSDETDEVYGFALAHAVSSVLKAYK